MPPRRRPHHRRRRYQEPVINLIPMTDVVLNLLFFFILATNVSVETSNLQVNLPRASSGKAVGQDDVTPVIAIAADGRVEWMGRATSDAALRKSLDALAAKGVSKVRLHADQASRHGRVVQVMEICRAARIADVLWDVNSESDAGQGGVGQGGAPPRP
jgi:biopolymer transport protein ExbD